MGQPIEVTASVVDDLALLIGDRSITGQDGAGFASSEEAAAAGGLEARLAAALFAADPGISHVFVGSNVATVRRDGGWDEARVERAADVMRTFFVYYGREHGTSDEPVGGVGAGIEFAEAAPFDEEVAEALRRRHYNATITSIDRIHDTLWLMRVRPDGEMPSYQAGQYATLGLGFWEPRLDGRREILEPDRLQSLARRSYSISSSILGSDGELLDPESETSLEFYVVLVEKDWREIPAVITPRLFAKDVGDRLYMGRKIAGRYRLDRVDDLGKNLVFLSTGTGEAPHNRMLLDLLRSGRGGRILAACSVRYQADLAYLDVHRRLEKRFDRYRYLALTTREPWNEGNKVYIQDMIASGALEDELGDRLDPERTHVFLCGNPGMIGLPEWDDDRPIWPETQGAAQLLVERGFTLDRPRVAGNLHYEEYW
jgi:ferredoxin/flavodoxin---NADP+ reductase